MSKVITIPNNRNPFELDINNREYSYKAGESVEVPDEVANAIENALALEPKPSTLNTPWKKCVDGSEDFELDESDLVGIEAISDNAFYYRENLVGIEIPNTTKTIGVKALYGCKKLLYIKIPESVTSIGNSALHIGTTEDLATIETMSATPPSIVTNTFYAPRINKIIVPKGCGATYKAAEGWSTFADYIVEKE